MDEDDKLIESWHLDDTDGTRIDIYFEKGKYVGYSYSDGLPRALKKTFNVIDDLKRHVEKAFMASIISIVGEDLPTMDQVADDVLSHKQAPAPKDDHTITEASAFMMDASELGKIVAMTKLQEGVIDAVTTSEFSYLWDITIDDKTGEVHIEPLSGEKICATIVWRMVSPPNPAELTETTSNDFGEEEE